MAPGQEAEVKVSLVGRTMVSRGEELRRVERLVRLCQVILSLEAFVREMELQACQVRRQMREEWERRQLDLRGQSSHWVLRLVLVLRVEARAVVEVRLADSASKVSMA